MTAWGRKYKKTWDELGFFERAAIIRAYKERRETSEDCFISKRLREARKRREQKEDQMAKLRVFLLSKRTKDSSQNTKGYAT